MRVFIFGASGMLGNYLREYLKNTFEIVPITRNEIDLNDDFSSISKKYTFEETDVIINAAGIIKQRNYSPEELIRVNSLFPHFLSTLNCKVIHITTDCVFSGKDGSYNEDAKHDCLDDYGKSKSLGENENLTVIRTSIIGEELYNKKSLIEWVKSNQNTTINGYLNHFWNGVTCLELAKHIENIINSNTYWKGVRHYCSPDTVSKYQLVSYINEVYELNNRIHPLMSDFCDRSLTTKYSSPVEKSIKDQIYELKEFGIREKLKNFPSIHFISIEESENRREVLYNQFKKYGIHKVVPHVFKRGCEDYDFINSKSWVSDDNAWSSYLGAISSHFSAIKDWYFNTDEEYAFFCEDDISFETVQYWNFTWDEFLNKLPSDWECVQLVMTRDDIMEFYQSGVYFGNRCWDDWSATGYLISRNHAENLIKTYCIEENKFDLEYRGIDKTEKYNELKTTSIENLLYTVFNNNSIFSFPLFVENSEFISTWNKNDSDLNKSRLNSYNEIINWWKNKGSNVPLDHIFNIDESIKFKLKNFPTLNFISIPESEDRRKVLYEQCEKYDIKTFSHIYERYKDGDSVIDLGEYALKYVYDSSYMGAFTSHLKAIKDWYEKTDEPYAVFCEDDVSFETVEYWNFTWEEFFNELPSDWQCVQMSLTRPENDMFRYFQPEVYLRPRCWDDWSCVSYLITRDYAKKLLDGYYYLDNTFTFSQYMGIDVEGRPEWALRPIIENYLYTNFDPYALFVFPLFVQNNNFNTVVWDNSGYSSSPVHDYSYYSIMEWWKTRGKNLQINDIFDIVKSIIP